MNNSKSINILTCMKFFKNVINNATEFIEDNKEIKTISAINDMRTNYCHLLWMKSIIDDIWYNSFNITRIFTILF